MSKRLEGRTIATPALQAWKTSAAYTIAGLLTPFCAMLGFAVFIALLQSLLGDLSYEVTIAFVSVYFASYLAFVFFYALKIYPSLFSEKPLLISSRAISFCNGFVSALAVPLWLSGIAFCQLWNHNLTVRKKGISHKVFVIVVVISLALFATFILALRFGSS